MPAMRKFVCYDCNKTFEVPYGTGGPGRAMKCPECGGSNIHRAEGDRGFERASGRGAGFSDVWQARGFAASCGPSALGRGRGGSGRGPRWA